MLALATAMMLTGAGAVQAAAPAPRPQLAPVFIAPPPPPPPRFFLPQRARANLNSYFSADDYPSAAVRGNDQGTVGFQLAIGPNGRVTECSISWSSGSLDLDRATCRILRARARYTPARSPDGTPIAGRDSGRVNWRLPADEPHERAGIPIPERMAAPSAPLASYITARDYPAAALGSGAAGTSMVHLVVDMIGRVIACDVDESSGSVALDVAACRLLRARARYAPARNFGGAFVCDVDWGEIAWVAPPPRRGPLRAPPPNTPRATPPTPIEQQLAPGACPGRTP